MSIDKTNPWHKVNIGVNSPDIVNGIIEIPKNTRAKYELDKESGMLLMDRVIFSSMHYPANYGFIPQTYCDDKDPLDILVLLNDDELNAEDLIQVIVSNFFKAIGFVFF